MFDSDVWFKVARVPIGAKAASMKFKIWKAGKVSSLTFLAAGGNAKVGLVVPGV